MFLNANGIVIVYLLLSQYVNNMNAEQGVKKVKRRLTPDERRIEKLEKRVDNLKEQVDRHERRFGDLEARFKKLKC